MSSTHDFQSPEFLRRLKERDKEAIEAVVRAYTKQLYNASLGLGFNDQEAHEVNQRMAFFLKEVEGHVSEEICNILEVSNTNLGVLLFRAKNKLRECIERKVKGEE